MSALGVPLGLGKGYFHAPLNIRPGERKKEKEKEKERKREKKVKNTEQSEVISAGVKHSIKTCTASLLPSLLFSCSSLPSEMDTQVRADGEAYVQAPLVDRLPSAHYKLYSLAAYNIPESYNPDRRYI